MPTSTNIRGIEIIAQHGTLHFPAIDLEQAVQEYRAWFKMPDTEEVSGRFQTWRDGAEQNDWKNISVELASRAESKSKVSAPKVQAVPAPEGQKS
jgi:hypothetical protein